ncbi:MAG: GlxA family transcriptional regulator [Oceanospirillaceae bacterium]|nr:GlxA family transcriptional regulator [Oceanospirillaceae bacterium]
MFAPQNPSKTINIAFYLVPEFSMIGFSALVDPLRQANSQSGQRLYQWQVISAAGGPVAASNGMSLVADCALGREFRLDMLVLCAGFRPEKGYNKNLQHWLQQHSRRGVWLGSQDTASYLLAKSGLLNGTRATIHWENLMAFKEVFRCVDVVDELYEIDGRRFTCSGGLAGLDMMLYLIQCQHGHELSLTVSDELIYSHMREGKAPQRMTSALRLGTNNRKLLTVIAAMENHLEEPLSIPQLASLVSVSERELERLFSRHLQQPPGRYYRAKRLQRARALLQQTDRQVVDIAIASGFGSAAHFSRAYRQFFNIAPSQDRHQQLRRA